MKKIFFLLLFISVNSFLFGQYQREKGGNAKISGVIVDETSKSTVPYATVMLYRNNDSTKSVNGIATDDNGKFVLENLPYGKFFLKIQFIGYTNKIIPNIHLKPDSSEIKFDTISLESASTSLSEVTVKGERSTVSYALDKKVINVGKDLSATGGNVADILKTLPSVNVDANGNLTLRGNSNVTVLVDGRPSNLTGMSLSTILDQIPVNMIESIEVITNPSAKYTPDGMSGVINIKLKKRQLEGLGGSITATAGTGNKYSGSINLSYKIKSVNFFGGYDFRWWEMKPIRRATGMYKSDSSTFAENVDDMHIRKNHNFRFGMDFFITEKQTLTFTTSYGINGEDESEAAESYVYYKDSSTKSKIFKKGEGTESGNQQSLSLNYRKTFSRKDQEFMVDMSFGKNKSFSEDLTVQNNFIPDISSIREKIFFDRKSQFFNAKTNYTHPFGQKSQFELGQESVVMESEFPYRVDSFSQKNAIWQTDSLQLNDFVYKEQYHSLYGTFAHAFLGFDFQLGLRFQMTNVEGNQKTTNQTFSYNYNDFFPTVHISRKLPAKNEVQISYSRRINRPPMRAVNPFVDKSTPGFIRKGNPSLKPEYFNSFEIGHNKEWEKTSLNSSIFYRYTDNIIRQNITIDSNNVRTFSFVNYSSAESYGLEFALNQQLLKWWRLNLTFGLSNNIIHGTSSGTELMNESFSWNSRLNSNMNFPKSIALQISGFYMGPSVTPQGKTKPNFSMDIAVKKDFLKDKLSVLFRVSDVFDSQKWNMIFDDASFTQNGMRRMNPRTFYLTLTYKLSQEIKGKQRKQEQRQQQEDYD